LHFVVEKQKESIGTEMSDRSQKKKLGEGLHFCYMYLKSGMLSPIYFLLEFDNFILLKLVPNA